MRLTYKEPIQGPTNVVTREIRSLSLSANYNEFDVNPKIEELYSGRLKRSVTKAPVTLIFLMSQRKYENVSRPVSLKEQKIRSIAA